jgi:L-alanine-DL-glutamate epimerase-like enolase superfamily enzyme
LAVRNVAAARVIEYSFADLGASPLGESIVLHNGRIAVPTGPGLGCDPDPAIVARYRLA